MNVSLTPCQSAIDYKRAAELDPNNSEYSKFLQKSIEKYEEAEGRPLKLVDNKADKVEVSTITSESVIVSDTTIRSNTVQSLPDLIIPLVRFYEHSKGSLSFTSFGSRSSAPAFVAIPIQIASDDESEDHRQESDFVRISIQNDDSDEDENNEESYQNNIVDEIDQESGIENSMSDDKKASTLKDYGNRCMQQSNFTKAIAVYSRSLQYCFSVLTLNNRAQAKLSAFDFIGAIDDSTSVLKVDSNNIKAMFRRAKAFSELNETSKALADIENILLFDPSNAPASKLKVELISKMEDEKSSTLRRKIAELKAKGDEAMKQEKFEDAISYYSDGLSLDEQNISFWSNRSLANLKLQRYEATVADTTSVIDLCSTLQSEQSHSVKIKALMRRMESLYQLGLHKNNPEFFHRANDDTAALESIDASNESLGNLRNLIKAAIQSSGSLKTGSGGTESVSRVMRSPGGKTINKFEVPTAPPKTLYE